MGITKEKLRAVVDTFEKGVKNHPNFDIDMHLYYIHFKKQDEKWFPACGCHASFYAICAEKIYPYERISWKKFASKLAHHLGFESSKKLQLWAQENPEIWGNFHGYEMFYNELAIGGYFDPFCDENKIVINPEIILMHWVGVMERFIECEEKQKRLK